MNRASRLMGVFLAFTSLLAFGTRALATGGFGCEIDDANLKLSVSAGLPGCPAGLQIAW